MNVGIIGTGAIARKHAQAYQQHRLPAGGLHQHHTRARPQVRRRNGCRICAHADEELCRRPDVDFIDVCTFPAYRLRAVELSAASHKHVLVQKPMAVDLDTAARMITIARDAGIQLGVVSQHRFDDSVMFLKRALAAGRLGRILQPTPT